VRSILDLAQGRELTCVAEGIEMTRVADELAEMGCQKGQGYWFSRPILASDLAVLLQNEMQASVS
jgi:EAL domain-containing protein (putative c-di-GMP-specific phosphodiesterase class I)